MQNDSTSDAELNAIASQCERDERARAQEEHEQEEVAMDEYHAELLMQHEAYVYREWEDRAMHDEMHQPKRRRGGLRVEATWSRQSGTTCPG